MKKTRTAFVCCLTSLLATMGCAQEQQASAIVVNGDGALSAGLWSGNRLLDERGTNLHSALLLNGGVKLDAQWRLKASVLAERFPSVRGDQWQSAQRELSLQWEGDSSDVKLGTQLFSWGRADRINPTDNLSARNYTLGLASDDEQRIGSPALSWKQELAGQTRVLAVVQHFRPGVGPNDLNEAALPWAAQSRNTDVAIKLDHSGDALDWSLSYFKGSEKSRSLQWLRRAGQIVGVARGFAPMSALGADAAMTQGAWTLRTEFAALRFASNAHADMGRQDHYFGVLGLERNLPASASFGMQYFFRRFEDDTAASFSNPVLQARAQRLQVANNQLHRYQDGLSLRYAQRILNDQIDYEIVAVVNFKDGDYALRPRLNWRMNDSLKWQVGWDVLHGSTQSFFGSLKKNTLGFVECVYVF